MPRFMLLLVYTSPFPLTVLRQKAQAVLTLMILLPQPPKCWGIGLAEFLIFKMHTYYLLATLLEIFFSQQLSIASVKAFPPLCEGTPSLLWRHSHSSVAREVPWDSGWSLVIQLSRTGSDVILVSAFCFYWIFEDCKPHQRQLYCPFCRQEASAVLCLG